MESRGVDTSETYYEIPHWMHLAFVSYDGEADNIGQPTLYGEETPMSKQFNPSDTTVPVAANGFILPSKDSFDSLYSRATKIDPNSPTSFSVNGIAAASPEKFKPLSQERALNEGRDFVDILEACRPRNSGSIPSALQAILKMYRRSEKIEHPFSGMVNEVEEEGETDELKPLREWSSLELDLDEPHRPRSGSFGQNEKQSERSDSSAISSPSSSYTSLVGVSFDRHLLGRSKVSAPLGGIHLQKSASLLPPPKGTNEDTDTVKSDSSWSTTGGAGDSGIDEELASSKAARKERNSQTNRIRRIMANHDSNYFVEPAIPLLTTTGDGLPSRQQVFLPLNESSVGSHSPITGTAPPVPPPQR